MFDPRIWNLCEHGVSLFTVKSVFKKEITIDDIRNKTLPELNEQLGRANNSFFSEAKEIIKSGRFDEMNGISLYHLTYFGLSVSAVDSLHEKVGWQIEEKYIYSDYLVDELGIRTQTSVNVARAMEKYNIMYATDSYIVKIKDVLKVSKIFEQITYRKLPRQKLSNYISNSLKIDEDYANKIIDILLESNKIQEVNGLFVRKVDKLEVCLQKRISPENLIIFKMRLQGKTLEGIGNELNLTKERIRQIVDKNMKKLKSVEEDKYQEIFKKYNFTKEVFCDFFNVDEEVYYYLNIKYKRGEESLATLFTKNFSILTESQKEVLLAHLDGKLIVRENEVLTATKKEIVEYLIKKHAQEGIHIKDFSVLYNDFVKGSSLELNTLRNVEAITSRASNVITTFGRSYRYYEFTLRRINDLYSTIEFSQYKGLLISTLKIYRDYPQLMIDLDIQNEYELHNFIKKTYRQALKMERFKTLKIYFKKMPMLLFSKEVEYDTQILALIEELSPVHLSVLSEEVYERFGIKKDTFLGSSRDLYLNYVVDDVIDLGIKEVDAKTIAKVKKLTTQKLYNRQHFVEILRANDIDDGVFLNVRNLAKINFTIKENYVYSSEFSSATDAIIYYLKNEITPQTVIEPRLYNSSVFRMRLTEMRRSLQIIKIGNGQFISIKELNKVGITVEKMLDLLTKIKEYEPIKGKDFNIFYLNKLGFKHEIVDIEKNGVDIYDNLLQCDESFQSFRLSGTLICSERSKIDLRKNLFVPLFNQYGSIYLETAVDYLKNDFNVEITDMYNLIYKMEEYGFYYHKPTKKFYLSEKAYLRKLLKNDKNTEATK